MAGPRDALVGNRLALAGAVLYFLEWVAIAFLPDVPTELLGQDPATIVAAYQGHAGVIAFAAGWFSVVLLGRVVFVAALRNALRESGRPTVWLDIALAAMLASVVLEIAAFGLTSAAGWMADAGATQTSIVALDSAGTIVYTLVFGPLGVAVLAASIGMVASGLFARWLGWLGLAAGGLGVVGGIVDVSALGATGTWNDLGLVPTSVAALGFWIWIIATSVVLFRSSPATKP